MLHLVLMQLAFAVFASAIAGLIGGLPALVSALLGGLCCVVPNALFALRLASSARRGTANPISFFIGEMIKIAMTIALLGAAVWMYHDLNALALIAGFIVALKSYLILLFRH